MVKRNSYYKMWGFITKCDIWWQQSFPCCKVIVVIFHSQGILRRYITSICLISLKSLNSSRCICYPHFLVINLMELEMSTPNRRSWINLQNLPYRVDLEKGNVISTAFGVQETFDRDWRKKVSTHFKTSMELQSRIKLLT